MAIAERETYNIQLSEREVEVLEMVATGASNQEIAQKLIISVNTVKVHLRNIFEKLEVRSRTEATLRAIQEGLIAVPDNHAAVASEISQSTTKTYLLVNDLRPALTSGQQLYLLVAMLLALLLVIIPLLPREGLYLHLPVITPYDRQHQHPATPVPAVPANPGSERWVSHAPMPTGRAGLALAAFEGQIFAIGGRREIGTTGLLEIYNSDSDSWSEGAAKPTATTDVTAVVFKNKIYVPGGCVAERQPITTLEIYDPGTNKWERGPDLPAPRCGYGLTVWRDQIYLFGGWNGHTYEDTIFVFSTDKNRWEVVDNVMPQAKGYLGAVNLEEKIYIVGGYDGQTEFDQTYLFMPDTGQWVQKASMHEKRGGLGLVTAANRIYAIGGGWERPLDSSEKYDPDKDEWTIFEAPSSEQWSNLALTTIGTKIYAVGGWNGAEEKYRDSMVSYQVLFQIFLPLSRDIIK